jgi:DNA polymerase III subunit gamma/tau
VALALYRKYRPRTFAEVIGQEHVTEPLIQAIRSGRLNHAYLFSGPRGCGKTSSARILARSLNCEKGPTPEPCGDCDSCRALAPDGPGSIDVIEIDAASHGGVDDARELRERAIFSPASSRFKIYIIDEAHMVSSAGFNALLKLVEEPPDYIKFVFATTEPEKVLGTIKSRTHHYPFRLVPPSALRPFMEDLCARENVAVEPQVLPLVVRAGGGSVRDSLSVLDQLIAGSGPQGVTYARAVDLLGVTDVALIDDMIDALAAQDGGAAFAAINRVAEAGHDSRRFAGDLLERLRDLIVLQQVPEAAANGLVDAPDDELARMRAQSGRLGAATLSRCADIVAGGLVEMRGATSPRLLLELIAARMLLPAADDSMAALLQRLERLEQGAPPAAAHYQAAAPTGAAPEQGRAQQAAPRSAPPASDRRSAVDTSAAPATRSAPADPDRSSAVDTSGAPPADHDRPTSRPVSVPVVAPVSPMSSPSAGGAIDAVAVRRAWDEIVRAVGRTSKKAAAFAREAVVRDIDGSTLVLLFKHRIHAAGVENDPKPLLEAAGQVLGGVWQVRCEVGGDARPAPAGGAPAPRPAQPQPTPATGNRPASTRATPPARSAAPTGSAAGGRTTSSATSADEAWPTTATIGGAAPADVHDTGPLDEPPYDPEFDGPPGGRPQLEGFAPGDEPTDEVIDATAARQTSEELALDSLRKNFNVEKIADLDK